MIFTFQLNWVNELKIGQLVVTLIFFVMQFQFEMCNKSDRLQILGLSCLNWALCAQFIKIVSGSNN